METLLNPTQGILYRNLLIFRCDCPGILNYRNDPAALLINHLVHTRNDMTCRYAESPRSLSKDCDWMSWVAVLAA